MLDPIQRRRYGIFAMLLALAFFGVAAAAGVVTYIQRQSVAKDISALNQECQNRMKILGAKAVSGSDSDLTATWDGVDGGYTTVGSASAAAMACPGWRMTRFCMGTGCSTPGATLTMSKVTS